MYDNFNYPVGTDTAYAPWNQKKAPEKNFLITCSQSLSKPVTITTDNYIPVEFDEDYADTSETVWLEEYKDNGYHTPLELLGILRQVLQENFSHGVIYKTPRITQQIIQECQGWTEDDCSFIEE